LTLDHLILQLEEFLDQHEKVMAELANVHTQEKTMQSDLSLLKGKEGNLGAEVLKLNKRLEEQARLRSDDQDELIRLKTELDQIRMDKESQQRQVTQRKSRLLSLLKGGWPVLKHGKHGSPKLRVLFLDEKAQTLVCKDEENPDKEIVMPLTGIQVRPR